jgi:hypothetical protein
MASPHGMHRRLDTVTSFACSPYKDVDPNSELKPRKVTNSLHRQIVQLVWRNQVGNQSSGFPRISFTETLTPSVAQTTHSQLARFLRLVGTFDSANHWKTTNNQQALSRLD